MLPATIPSWSFDNHRAVIADNLVTLVKNIFAKNTDAYTTTLVESEDLICELELYVAVCAGLAVLTVDDDGILPSPRCKYTCHDQGVGKWNA